MCVYADYLVTWPSEDATDYHVGVKNGTNGQDSSELIVFIRCCHIGGDD